MIQVPNGARRLVISLSGGETSTRMARLLLDEYAHLFDEVLTLFANTGQENEQTLEFVRQFELYQGQPVVWLEAVVDPRHGVGTTFKVVDFITAARNGEPFEEVIRKYGIPNKSYPHCTRELKLNPIYAYLDSIGWAPGSYAVAVGMRADEPRRLRKTAHEQGLIYPLAHWQPMDKTDVQIFWEDEPYRLGLESYQGNCRTCWKKSTAKLVRIMRETPEAFDFFERMEREHGLSGSNKDGRPRRFFRGHQTVADIRAQAVGITPPVVDSDAGDGCSESCEAFGPDELEWLLS